MDFGKEQEHDKGKALIKMLVIPPANQRTINFTKPQDMSNFNTKAPFKKAFHCR